MKKFPAYQQISVFILMISLFALTTQKEFILADYLLNTKNYAEKCVNKEVKEMHCNGKCQMAKKMKATENDNPQQPKSQTKLADIILYCENVMEFKTQLFSTEVFMKNIRHEQIVQKTNGYTGFTLHPPII